MPVPSKKVIKRQRVFIADKKGRFEDSFKKIFRRWHKRVFNEFVSQVQHGATITIIPSDLRDELRILLQEHYRNVAKGFVKGLEFSEQKQAGGTPLPAVDESEDDDDLFVVFPFPDNTPGGTPLPGTGSSDNDSTFVDFLIPGVLTNIETGINAQITVQSPVHFNSIIDTTERVGTESVMLANEKGEEGSYPVILGAKLAGKETTTFITETDWIAEASMGTALNETTPAIEIADKNQLKELREISPNITLRELDVDELFAGSLIALEATKRVLANPQKMWLTVGGKRVRPSHQAVNGVQIPVTQPFRLLGGMLMFPADSSLGVSFKEIVNCRCHALYF